MDLKTYFKLLFHTTVTLLITLSAPITLSILLSNKVEPWVTVAALAPATVTIYFGIKYVIFIVYKKDIFKDMF